MASMTLRFTDEKAVSCAGGNWRRVAVSGLTAADQKFFPGTEPLSYDVTGSALLIGRNEICDSYLTLKGELTENTASGEYVSESMFSSRKLGRFIGIRVQ